MLNLTIENFFDICMAIANLQDEIIKLRSLVGIQVKLSSRYRCGLLLLLQLAAAGTWE